MEIIVLFFAVVLMTFAASVAAVGVYERGTRDNRGVRPGSP